MTSLEYMLSINGDSDEQQLAKLRREGEVGR